MFIPRRLGHNGTQYDVHIHISRNRLAALPLVDFRISPEMLVHSRPLRPCFLIMQNKLVFYEFFKIRHNGKILILPESVPYTCKKDANILLKVFEYCKISANFANTRYFQLWKGNEMSQHSTEKCEITEFPFSDFLSCLFPHKWTDRPDLDRQESNTIW